MKIVYLITTILSIILLGCSSTYRVSDFPSKEKFYDNYNKSANDKTIIITLNNDSTYTAFEGSEISNDSLTYTSQIKNEQINIKPAEIKDIKYFGTDMSKISADILLKNGKKARAENVSLLSDSSITAVISYKVYKTIPINNIKKVSYKNHFLGLPQGFLGGIIGGLFVSYLVYNVAGIGSNQRGNETSFYGGVAITSLGLIGGSVLGWINGYTYTYQFNP